MHTARKEAKNLTEATAAVMSKDKKPPADPHAGIDDLLLLKRDRAVVQMLRDEEVLFDDENFERRIEPPGHRARARIAFGLREILEPEEAASLLAYLDRRGWKFRFSLAPRDLRLSYKPRWFFRFLAFEAVWLFIALPFIPGDLYSLIFFSPDWTLLKIVLIVCSAASVLSSLVYYEFDERARMRRVALRERRLTENAEFSRERGHSQCRWMSDEKDVAPPRRATRQPEIER